jgi:hypothetical protein
MRRALFAWTSVAERVGSVRAKKEKRREAKKRGKEKKEKDKEETE